MSTRPTSGSPAGDSGNANAEKDRMLSDCERIAPILHRYVEGELDPVRSHMVESHLASCPVCLDEKERLDLERLWLVENAFDGPVLSPRLIDKVMASVEREASAGTRARRWWWLTGTCAAACLLALVFGYGFEIWSPSGSASRSGTEIADGKDTAGKITDRASSIARTLDAAAPVVGVSAGDLQLTPEERRPDERRRRVRANRSVRAALVENHLEGFEDDASRSETFAFFERSGFRVDATKPTFVDFVPSGLSCLPQAPRESWQCESSLSDGGEESRGEENRAVRRVRVFHVRLSPGHGTRSFRFRFHDTFGIALRLTRSQSGEIRGSGANGGTDAGWSDLDPCIPDPNADGRTDSGDIAYGLQMLYGAQPPDAMDTDSVALDPECEGSCLKA